MVVHRIACNSLLQQQQSLATNRSVDLTSSPHRGPVARIPVSRNLRISIDRGTRTSASNSSGSQQNSCGRLVVPKVLLGLFARARVGVSARRSASGSFRLVFPVAASLRGNLRRNMTVGNASVARSQTGFAADGQAL